MGRRRCARNTARLALPAAAPCELVLAQSDAPPPDCHSLSRLVAARISQADRLTLLPGRDVPSGLRSRGRADGVRTFQAASRFGAEPRRRRGTDRCHGCCCLASTSCWDEPRTVDLVDPGDRIGARIRETTAVTPVVPVPLFFVVGFGGRCESSRIVPAGLCRSLVLTPCLTPSQ